MAYRDPYGVALVIGPFNGPLLLLLRPAITALAAGNMADDADPFRKLAEEYQKQAAKAVSPIDKQR
jgi:hypothetical protein